jgi:hypothetical protein
MTAINSAFASGWWLNSRAAAVYRDAPLVMDLTSRGLSYAVLVRAAVFFRLNSLRASMSGRVHM